MNEKLLSTLLWVGVALAALWVIMKKFGGGVAGKVTGSTAGKTTTAQTAVGTKDPWAAALGSGFGALGALLSAKGPATLDVGAPTVTSYPAAGSASDVLANVGVTGVTGGQNFPGPIGGSGWDTLSNQELFDTLVT